MYNENPAGSKSIEIRPFERVPAAGPIGAESTYAPSAIVIVYPPAPETASKDTAYGEILLTLIFVGGDNRGLPTLNEEVAGEDWFVPSEAFTVKV